mgnify:CR=1 FL=1
MRGLDRSLGRPSATLDQLDSTDIKVMPHRVHAKSAHYQPFPCLDSLDCTAVLLLTVINLFASGSGRARRSAVYGGPLGAAPSARWPASQLGGLT